MKMLDLNKEKNLQYSVIDEFYYYCIGDCVNILGFDQDNEFKNFSSAYQTAMKIIGKDKAAMYGISPKKAIRPLTIAPKHSLMEVIWRLSALMLSPMKKVHYKRFNSFYLLKEGYYLLQLISEIEKQEYESVLDLYKDINGCQTIFSSKKGNDYFDELENYKIRKSKLIRMEEVRQSRLKL